MYWAAAVAVNLNHCTPPEEAIVPSAHSSKTSAVTLAVGRIIFEGAVVDSANPIKYEPLPLLE
jgi:hypothetical protein